MQFIFIYPNFCRGHFLKYTIFTHIPYFFLGQRDIDLFLPRLINRNIITINSLLIIKN